MFTLTSSDGEVLCSVPQVGLFFQQEEEGRMLAYEIDSSSSHFQSTLMASLSTVRNFLGMGSAVVGGPPAVPTPDLLIVDLPYSLL